MVAGDGELRPNCNANLKREFTCPRFTKLGGGGDGAI